MARLPIALLILALAGCAQRPSDSAGLTVIPDVPAFAARTRSDDCGSVALASLLAHAGHPAAPAVIDREIYDPVIGGSLLFAMEDFAAARGASPHSGRGSLDVLRTLLAAGTPVLLPIDVGWGVWRRPHYVVVFGTGEDDFLMYEQPGDPVVISAAKLDRQWAKTGRLYLYLE